MKIPTVYKVECVRNRKTVIDTLNRKEAEEVLKKQRAKYPNRPFVLREMRNYPNFIGRVTLTRSREYLEIIRDRKYSDKVFIYYDRGKTKISCSKFVPEEIEFGNAVIMVTNEDIEKYDEPDCEMTIYDIVRELQQTINDRIYERVSEHV